MDRLQKTMWLRRRKPVRDLGSWIQSTPMRSHIADVGPRGSFRRYLLPRTEQCVLVRDMRFWAVRVLDRARAPRSLHTTAVSCQVEVRVQGRCSDAMFRLSPNTVCHRGDPLQALSARTLCELNIVLWIKYGSGGGICTGPAPSTKQPITSGLDSATAQLAAEVFCESTFWGRCRSADLLLQSGPRELHFLQDSCRPAPPNVCTSSLKKVCCQMTGRRVTP